MLNKIEAYAGVLAGIAGIAGLAYFVFGATGTEGTEEMSSSGVLISRTTQHTRMIDEGLPPIAIALIVVDLLLLYKISRSAWIHGHTSNTGSGIWLCFATIIFWMSVIISGFSIGFYLFPAAILALIALLACGFGRDPITN